MRRKLTLCSERRRRRRRQAHAAYRIASKGFKNGGRQSSATSNKVSAKLEALKNLIPVKDGEVVKPDQLFEETADYIVRLRNQVFVLQKLIQLYGSAQPDDLMSS